MGPKVESVCALLFLTLGPALGQSALSGPASRPLPQWLTGIIAVVGFLFLTFVVFIVKRAWCEKSKGDASDSESNHYEDVTEESQPRLGAEMASYSNLGLERDEDRVTAM
ncbi:unnamed protein product [Knipowitschia caucasica]|uniref:Uncharacterized protein n=1 Tax=Knipowitschia caucasica TaxID=637954 RepID=A0AAV2KTZ8_KNICA